VPDAQTIQEAETREETVRAMNFTPIPTMYAGYKFRSRTEARWAVFFDTLGIKYRYEIDGFNLDGARYLPDFWLSQQDCWIEVKGQKPTEQEHDKATLLSIYTEKPVYIFWGDVWIPEDESGGAIEAKEVVIGGDIANYDDDIRKKILSEDSFFEENEFSDCLYPVSPHIEALFYQLGKEEASLRVSKGKLYVDAPLGSPSRKTLERIKGYERELIQLLSSLHDGWRWSVHDLYAGSGYGWMECLECHKLWIGRRLFGCNKCSKGRQELSSPRLMAAYTKARQARFEHGETP
jgi:DNA-dependent RNA polymerase auxiliary subunit epsilon